MVFQNLRCSNNKMTLYTKQFLIFCHFLTLKRFSGLGIRWPSFFWHAVLFVCFVLNCLVLHFISTQHFVLQNYFWISCYKKSWHFIFNKKIPKSQEGKHLHFCKHDSSAQWGIYSSKLHIAKYMSPAKLSIIVIISKPGIS